MQGHKGNKTHLNFLLFLFQSASQPITHTHTQTNSKGIRESQRKIENMVDRSKLSRYQIFFGFQLLVLLQIKVTSSTYKVGDLNAWGIPTDVNPHVYTYWSKKHQFQIGDSLLFLYPPSQDSLIQVAEESFNTCNLKNPILYIDNGNSLFNITSQGKFYFTSGVPGHCEKSQKLQISVGNVSDLSPSYSPSALPDTAPSYPTVFGSIPSTSFSSQLQVLSTTIVGTFTFIIVALMQ